MSAAVRPMALAPDEQTVYFQVSFFHGFVEYDLVRDRVLRLAHLPLSEEAAGKRRDEYLLDSAHHGLTMNPAGTKLCAAGTMSDYAAIVDRATFAYRIVPVGRKPYWSTNSGDGRYCFVSVSGDDRVSVISYATEREIARIPVGDHPQRMRMGKLDVAVRKPKLRVRVKPRRVRAHKPVTLRIRVTERRAGERVPVRGARVRAAGKRVKTNRRGRAKVRKRDGFQEVRRYKVRAKKAGYRRDVARIRVLGRRGG
jgi:YVTN family beta-propeller protein